MDTPTDVAYVRVMSLRKSKGLTVRVVIVMGCNEGMIPRIDYEDTPTQQKRSLVEQRRLFYVAMTRRRKPLILSNIAHTSMQQALQICLGVQGGGASQFVAQLGPSRPTAISGQELLG